MALMVTTTLEAATGAAGAAQFTAGDMPLFEPDEAVYLLSDFPPAGATNVAKVDLIEYTVDRINWAFQIVATVSEIHDQAGLATVNDGAQTRAIAGWNHTTTPGDARSATTLSVPWFYRIRRTSDGKFFEQVHQSQLTNITSAETFVATEIAGWLS